MRYRACPAVWAAHYICRNGVPALPAVARFVERGSLRLPFARTRDEPDEQLDRPGEEADKKHHQVT